VTAARDIRAQLSHPVIDADGHQLARVMTWLDTFGIDSELDYDPFWARCVALGVSPTAHMAGLWGTRTSVSSYVHKRPVETIEVPGNHFSLVNEPHVAALGPALDRVLEGIP
jgi:hypothetical protein